jgi:hypothetical protein
MGYSCKGVCESLKGKSIPNGSRYTSGQKRCSLCCLFFSITSNRCPCCSVLLRTKSRNKKL